MSSPAFLRSLRFWGRSGPSIFISYRRRGDSAGFAARLADRLVAHFGAEQCFRDIEDIESGTDFVEAIESAVDACAAMIVVIGSDWLTTAHADGGRRLDDPADFVRIEVATGLRRGIRVVPVLVCGATMPPSERLPSDLQALARRQAHELTDSRWEYDVGQLVASLEGIGIRPAARRSGPVAWLPPRLRTAALSVVGIVGLGLAGLSVLPLMDGSFGGPDDVPPAYLDAPDPGGDDGTTDPPSRGADVKSDASSRTAEVESDRPARTAGGERPSSPSPSRAASDGGGAPARTDPAPDPADRYRAELIDAVNEANDAQLYALSTLDASGLTDYFEGAALQTQIELLTGMAMNGITITGEMLGQRIRGVSVDERRMEATVDVVETWSLVYHNAATGMCVGVVPSVDLPAVNRLRRTPAGWLIYDIGGDAQDLQPIPC